MKHTDLTQGHTIANEVKVDLDVFGSLILNWVSGHVDGADVVAEHNRGGGRWSMKLVEKLPDPTSLSNGVGNSTVLGFSTGTRNSVLPLGRP